MCNPKHLNNNLGVLRARQRAHFCAQIKVANNDNNDNDNNDNNNNDNDNEKEKKT
jgi:hypothetical protein